MKSLFYYILIWKWIKICCMTYKFSRGFAIDLDFLCNLFGNQLYSKYFHANWLWHSSGSVSKIKYDQSFYIIWT